MTSPDVYITIDGARALSEQPEKGHNRWHPDIPPVVTVDQDQVVGIETLDAFDGQIARESTVAEIGSVNLNRVHPLTGPVYINGAEPEDILEVTILEVEPRPFAFTVQVPGFGFLRDVFTEPHIVRWRISDGYATSEDLPGVRLPGAPFMGVIGVAPSHELLEKINRRESALADRGVRSFFQTPRTLCRETPPLPVLRFGRSPHTRQAAM